MSGPHVRQKSEARSHSMRSRLINMCGVFLRAHVCTCIPVICIPEFTLFAKIVISLIQHQELVGCT